MHRLLKTVLRETLTAASPCFPSAAFTRPRPPVQLTVACQGGWDFLRTEQTNKQKSFKVGWEWIALEDFVLVTR